MKIQGRALNNLFERPDQQFACLFLSGYLFAPGNINIAAGHMVVGARYLFSPDSGTQSVCRVHRA